MTAFTYGIRNVELVLNCLFKSLPHKLVLKLPAITPSGFSIGIILKTTFFLKSIASSEFEQINFRNPFNIWLPQVYPGWILPQTKIHFFFVFYISGSVIVSNGKSTPPND